MNFYLTSFANIGIVIMLFLIAGCQRKKSEVVWNSSFPVIGSQSSPRVADLNDDGVLDIVMGAGKNEYQYSRQGIIALDGKTGELLWQQEATDQVYGSATFHDINNDGVKDVFIGGRSPNFRALDGKTGKILWSYQHIQYAEHPILKYARYNFNNSVLVPDQNHDGLADLLTVNGGNSKAEPNSEVNRFPGVMILFDSKNGTIIAADTMPDGKETYMSPLCFAQPGSKDFNIVYGTGGETISGNLYLARLSDLTEGKLENSKILAADVGHGFIAPAVIADVSSDGMYDIIAISHGSNIFAVEGTTQALLWKRTIANTESSNSLAVGYFTDDDIPDFFTFVSRGQWPASTGSLQIMLNGKSGTVEYTDSIGCTGFSSPVVYDLNADGYDDVILSVNEFDCSLGFTGKAPADIQNELMAIDFRSGLRQTIDRSKGFKNIFSTPWIGDLDNDGYLDIINCQYYHYGDLMLFLGMRMKRISTAVRVDEPPAWGGYMGSDSDGAFRGSK